MQRVIGALAIGAGVYLVMSPMVVARVLDRSPSTTSQMIASPTDVGRAAPPEAVWRLINLRASWGGTLTGIGAFVVWLPGLRPWLRTIAGLVLWSMAGIGFARAIGFVADGDPDARQLVWITAEAVLVIGAAVVLRTTRK
jgi:hypothetical protein